ncbi:MAG TPA: TetR/AcrR family transcriptional regulator [Desulfomonilaceae bacterium]|nr:TetR/AcrR family transcriptional regulator [Desulfomonilaceae bacterium]
MESSISKLDSGRSPSRATRPNRRERRRTEMRERVIRAALRLFSERGVTATTVEDITNEADVGKGTFFNYFPSKEDILAHLCQLQMGKIREFVARSLHSRESMDRVLYELALILIEEFSNSPALVKAILAALFSSESARERMADDFAEDREVLAALMAARQDRGEIRDDLTPSELALQFQRALFGTTVLWSLDPSKPLSEHLEQMSNVLWRGIRTQAAP